MIGVNRLPLVNNISFNIFSDDDYEHDPTLEHASEEAVEEATTLMDRLPPTLRRLHLQPPYHEWPYFISDRRSHPLLLKSLSRFKSLQELDLDFEDQYCHLDMFTSFPQTFGWGYTMQDGRIFAGKYSGQRIASPHPAAPLPPPMFPHLRRLSLAGCISDCTTTSQAIKAFSEEQLPSLESLRIDGLLCGDPRDIEPEGWLLVPEALNGMHTLVEFEWVNYDFNTRLSRTKGEPHVPPGRSHFEALRSRHGQTLRTLKIDYTDWSQFGSDDLFYADLDAEYVRTFVEELPSLKNVLINAAAINICVVKGNVIDDEEHGSEVGGNGEVGTEDGDLRGHGEKLDENEDDDDPGDQDDTDGDTDEDTDDDDDGDGDSSSSGNDGESSKDMGSDGASDDSVLRGTQHGTEYFASSTGGDDGLVNEPEPANDDTDGSNQRVQKRRKLAKDLENK
ncbi:hypothetical protein K4F52_009583 [Lecanicillium sp. MT-2017a]|nr:hypothetical protein K4F52_009583 [Lecanicillium sp. MT-2017a]